MRGDSEGAGHFTLQGTVTSTSGTAIPNATVRVSDGVNAGRSATTSSNGSYSLTGLSTSGFTLSASATNFVSVGKPVTLTSSQTVDFQLTPTPLFTRSGIGDTVFDVPTTVTRLRIDATYTGSCQNFIVRISTTVTSLVNVIIGTCSVADTRSPFSGTYAINNGGTVSITSSTRGVDIHGNPRCSMIGVPAPCEHVQLQ